MVIIDNAAGEKCVLDVSQLKLELANKVTLKQERLFVVKLLLFRINKFSIVLTFNQLVTTTFQISKTDIKRKPASVRFFLIIRTE